MIKLNQLWFKLHFSYLPSVMPVFTCWPTFSPFHFHQYFISYFRLSFELLSLFYLLYYTYLYMLFLHIVCGICEYLNMLKKISVYLGRRGFTGKSVCGTRRVRAVDFWVWKEIQSIMSSDCRRSMFTRSLWVQICRSALCTVSGTQTNPRLSCHSSAARREVIRTMITGVQETSGDRRGGGRWHVWGERCQSLRMCPGKHMYDVCVCVGGGGAAAAGETAPCGRVLLPSLAPGLGQVHNSCLSPWLNNLHTHTHTQTHKHTHTQTQTLYFYSSEDTRWQNAFSSPLTLT